MKICVTGPRFLTPAQCNTVSIIANGYLQSINTKDNPIELNVGDAKGVDYQIYLVGQELNLQIEKHEVEDKTKKFSYAERSMRMVNNSLGGVLLGFPNEECPKAVTPNNAFCGSGSGTWGTIAYAKYRDLTVVLLPLDTKIKFPSWL